MFDAGFSELLLLFVIALVILGPERLPKVAAQLGRWIGRARRTATELRRQLEREIELSEVTKPRPAPKPPTPPPSEASPPTAEPPAAEPDTNAPESATAAAPQAVADPEPPAEAADAVIEPPTVPAAAAEDSAQRS